MYANADVNHPMKKMMVTVAFMVTMVVANAQEKNYWVVETDSAGRSVVKIYDVDNRLVSASTAERRINIHKKKERKMLSRMMKQTTQLLWSKR